MKSSTKIPKKRPCNAICKQQHHINKVEQQMLEDTLSKYEAG